MIMRHLNYHHLYIFSVFGRTGSFTRTAEELRIAQSAVTTQIRALEEAMGLSLVDRTNPRRPTLTDDGLRVLDYANSIFELGDELMNWVSKGESFSQNTLRVGALTGLSRNLQYEFLKPAISEKNLRLYVQTGDQDNLIRLLIDHTLDVVLSPYNVRPDGRVSFYSHILTSSPIRFVILSEKAGRKNRTLKDYLSQFPLVLMGQNFDGRPQLDAYLDTLKVKLHILAEIDDIALLRLFAVNSGCVVALPEMGVIKEVQDGSVRVIGSARGVEQRFYAITRQKRVRNHLVERLIMNMKKG
ncbi:MAG: LysR family transcriptional regulator [Bdellovibrionaceae bacterium]|nr:LysR family transcriptional regulator [Pseudobdellovibrionaceae bacterium]